MTEMYIKVSDLANVKGIGKKTIERVKDKLVEVEKIKGLPVHYDQSLELSINNIYNGDCLKLMNGIKDKSVDMILCDLPYGTTVYSWDEIISFDKLWAQYERIIKDGGAIVLFGNEPFTSKLINSNQKMFKYKWIWQKTKPIGYPMANYRPLKSFEEIMVFTTSPCTYTKDKGLQGVYNPQGLLDCGMTIKRGNSKHLLTSSSGGNLESNYIKKYTNYPRDIVEFSNGRKETTHPTEKPVDLCEYIIKTYTNKGELILDNCIGSGTTAIACINTNRSYIGIELDEEYYNIAKNRVNDHIAKKSI